MSSNHANSLRNRFINVGEVITRQEGFMKGHGVMVRGENLVSCVAGFIEQTNKLIFVRPIKTRYVPEVGDVVVGRVQEVGDKIWSIDIGGQLHAQLVLRYGSLSVLDPLPRCHSHDVSVSVFLLFFRLPIGCCIEWGCSVPFICPEECIGEEQRRTHWKCGRSSKRATSFLQRFNP